MRSPPRRTAQSLAFLHLAGNVKIGFTIRRDERGSASGNDVSARGIEGENPLYLPQAKVYDGCCALGPAITLASSMPPRPQIGIDLKIERGGTTVCEGTTSVARMARTFEELMTGWAGTIASPTASSS